MYVCMNESKKICDFFLKKVLYVYFSASVVVIIAGGTGRASPDLRGLSLAAAPNYACERTACSE